MKRTIAAFLVAPLIPAVAYMRSISGPALAFLYSYLWCYLLGIPTFFLLRKMKKESHVAYTSLAFIFGSILVLHPDLFEGGTLDSQDLIISLVFAAIAGAAGFCFSAIRGP